MSDFVVGGSSERLVPRTTEARNTREAAAVVARRRGRPAAWWGMAMVVASEATLFGTFFGTYYYLRFTHAQWPPDGIPRPAIAVPLILAGVLVTTSLPMQLGARAARFGRLWRARGFVALALFVQCGYFAYQVHAMAGDLRVFQPSTDAYGSIYYVLLGADHAHVFVGMLLDLWLLGKLVTGFTTYRINAYQAVAFYWHAVNILTLCVTGVLLSAAV